jgi:hypothetical protein
MPMQLDGPGLAPLAGGKAASLVVLLHGVGANGNDLISLARSWRTILPETEFIAPNAPFPCDYAPEARQWFENTYVAETQGGAHLRHITTRAGNPADLRFSAPFCPKGPWLAAVSLLLSPFLDSIKSRPCLGIRRIGADHPDEQPFPLAILNYSFHEGKP